MRMKEAIDSWFQEQRAIIDEISEYKSDEYKNGLADGIEIAIESLVNYLEKCEDY